MLSHETPYAETYIYIPELTEKIQHICQVSNAKKSLSQTGILEIGDANHVLIIANCKG